jgi:hypothetical protein
VYNGWKNNHILLSLCLFLILNSSGKAAISILESAPKYLILSSFKSNKEIWGTYNQIFEAGYKINNKGKRIKRNSVSNPIANILFKEGKIFFIRPSQKKNSISLEVLGLPYKKIKKRTYRAFTEGFKEQLYSIFEEHIQGMIKKGLYKKERIHTLSINDVVFKDATCKKKKQIYHCEFPIELRKSEERKIENDEMNAKDKQRGNGLSYNPIMKELTNKLPLFHHYQQQLNHRQTRRAPSNKRIH